jgi:hypothetical protein
MSNDYTMVCFTCKKEGPIFASGSIGYGFKVWDIDDIRKWLGHGEACGFHEGHDLRIVNEGFDGFEENSPTETTRNEKK